MHIRQHQAVEIENTSGLIRAARSLCDGKLIDRYSIKHPDIRYGSIDLIPKNDQFLKFSIYLEDASNGTAIHFGGDKVKIHYANGNTHEIKGTLTSTYVQFPVGQPLSEKKMDTVQVPFEKSFIFLKVGPNKKESLLFEALIPKENIDFEMEIPELRIGKDILTPKVLKFQWSDRWTVTPLNGC